MAAARTDDPRRRRAATAGSAATRVDPCTPLQPLNTRSYAVVFSSGGLEGLCPSKKLSLLAAVRHKCGGQLPREKLRGWCDYPRAPTTYVVSMISPEEYSILVALQAHRRGCARQHGGTPALPHQQVAEPHPMSL